MLQGFFNVGTIESWAQVLGVGVWELPLSPRNELPLPTSGHEARYSPGCKPPRPPEEEKEENVRERTREKSEKASKREREEGGGAPSERLSLSLSLFACLFVSARNTAVDC